MKQEFKYSSFIPMKNMERKFILNFISKFPRRSKILDAGCGNSKLIEELRKKGFEALGIDLNIENRKYIIQEDMRQQRFPKETFDVVLCINTLENVGLGSYGEYKEKDGDRKALLEFKRVLKKNGRILIMIAFGEATIKPRKRHPFRVYDTKQLKKLIEGFEVEEEHYFYYDIKEKKWKEGEPKKVIKVFNKQVYDCLGNAYLILKKGEK